MSFDNTSPVFQDMTGNQPHHYNPATLDYLANFINRSDRLARFLAELQAQDGRIVFDSTTQNASWDPNTGNIRLNPGRWGNDSEATVEQLVGVLAHEAWHFWSYRIEGFNPDAESTPLQAAVAGVRDEAIGNATSYLEARDINNTPQPSGEPPAGRVDSGLTADQIRRIEARILALGDDATYEQQRDAAASELMQGTPNIEVNPQTGETYWEQYARSWYTSRELTPQQLSQGPVTLIDQDGDSVVDIIQYRPAGATEEIRLRRIPGSDIFEPTTDTIFIMNEDILKQPARSEFVIGPDGDVTALVERTLNGRVYRVHWDATDPNRPPKVVRVEIDGADENSWYKARYLIGIPPQDFATHPESNVIWAPFVRHIEDASRFVENAPNLSPLIFDLDGDGVETLPLLGNAFFDHDDNGFAERSGWAAPDDGLLVWDRNGNGIIDDGKELFGSNTILINGAQATDGFQALAERDSNGDGKIDATDAVWSNLKIWKETDGDGISTERGTGPDLRFLKQSVRWR